MTFKFQKKFIYRSSIRVFILAAAFMFLTSGAHAAFETGPTEDPCDVEYMQSLKAQGWLQGQREITQNQNLIFKPDSVLEYTCFKGFLDILAKTANCKDGSALAGSGECGGDTPVERQLFSESERWSSMGIGGGAGAAGGPGGGVAQGIMPSWGLPLDLSLDMTLDIMVRQVMSSWISNNFSFASDDPDKARYFLGNRSHPEYPLFGKGLQYKNDPPQVIPRDYWCSLMNKVWEEAKCMDFVDVPSEIPAPDGEEFQSEDGFYRFLQYMEHPDKRFLPERCERPVAEDPDMGNQERNRWEINIEDAYLNEDTTPWEEEPVEAFMDEIDHRTCGEKEDGELYAPPIPTGLFVKREDNDPEQFFEKICVQPGCYYRPVTPTSGNCVKADKVRFDNLP